MNSFLYFIKNSTKKQKSAIYGLKIDLFNEEQVKV